MHLTLLVPGLLWPREILRDTTFDLPLPALSLLLGRGSHRAGAGEETWLGETFGIDVPLPGAALRLLGDGGNPVLHDWLCLDPVHLRLSERFLLPDDPANLALRADEDAALRASVAPLFAAQGEIVAPRPGHWHLRLTHPVAIETRSLREAIGRPADPSLPGGADGPNWRRLLAEVQPLLHDHAVNQKREADGRPAANSLWPWGAGRLPVRARRAFDRLWLTDPVLCGVAALAGIAVEPVPPRFTIVGGRVMVRLPHLDESLISFDATAWREALKSLEAEWIAPAMAALKSGGLSRLALVATGHDRTLQVTLGRRELRRFWRRPLKLADLEP